MGQTVTAYLSVRGAAEAIEFYKRAFGAEERYRIPNPDGRIGHAELSFGDSIVSLADEWPEMGVLSPLSRGGTTVSLVLEVPDCDAVFERAVAAGASIERPLTDAPYGRGGWLIDPFGHRWSVMTPNPEFKPEDLA